jgi:hypothetical protein
MAKRAADDRPLSLYEAAWHFSPRSMKLKAKAESSRPFEPSSLPRLAGGQRHEGLEHFGNALNAVGEFVHNLRDPFAPSPEMMRGLISRLREGKLEAVGIKTKPQIGDGPETIPPFIFKGRPKLSWMRNAVENYGKRFEAVEVVQPRDAKRTAVVDGKQNLRGRPTRSDQIDKAITALLEGGTELANMPRKRAYETIRAYVRKTFRADAKIGFSDPVLQRHLFRRFGNRR